jgi:hypothetical protein
MNAMTEHRRGLVQRLYPVFRITSGGVDSD